MGYSKEIHIVITIELQGVIDFGVFLYFKVI
jgi:hypothetical protein